MKVQSGKRFHSTKFVVLHDSQTTANGRKKKIIWIGLALLLTVLITTTVSYFCYKLYIAPNEYDDADLRRSTVGNLEKFNNPKSSKNIFNRRWIITEKQKRLAQGRGELTCKESQLQAIPLNLLKNTEEVNSSELYSLISLDLLLHYEDIINKYVSRRLKLIFNEYYSQLSEAKTIQGFVNFLTRLKSNKFEFYARYIRAENVDFGVSDWKSLLDLTDELNRWYNYLERLTRFLALYDQQKNRENYLLNVTEINFNKFTKETQEKLFRFAYPFNVTEKKLEEINQVLTDWATPFKTEIVNSSAIFFGKALLLSEVNTELNNSEFSSSLKSVFIFASRIMYMDENLTLNGVNVAIIAPNWVFLRKIKINLNGTAGLEHESDTAETGQPGKPGNAGGNAGDFLGVGDLNEKFLTVYSDGGRGGGGQNGAPGRGGLNYTRPGPPIDKPTCVFKTSSFNNSFGHTITHYKIYGEAGCGGSGTNGGVGGEGGRGGEVTLITKESRFKATKGSDGKSGSPGKGGAGGPGGHNGCFYEAFDVDDEVLHCVTTTKCPFGETLPSGEPGADDENGRGEIFPAPKENLSVSVALFHYIRFAAEDFVQNEDLPLEPFFKMFSHPEVIRRETNPEYVLKTFKHLEELDNFELYDFLKEHVSGYLQERKAHCSVFKYLSSILLGKMTVLKSGFNYFFVDFNSYLSTVQKGIQHVNQTTEFPPVTYLRKKMEIKLNKMENNLKVIERQLISRVEDEDESIESSLEAFSARKKYKHLTEALQRKRISCIMLSGLEIMVSDINRSRKKNVQFENLLNSCSATFDVLKSVAGSEKDKYSEILTTASTFSSNIQGEVKAFSDFKKVLNGDAGRKENLLEIRNGFNSLKKSVLHSEWGRTLLESLADELEHLTALYKFIDWEDLEKSFIKSLYDLTDDDEFLRSRLMEVIIELQFKLAVDAARQRLYPFVRLNHRLRPSRNKTVEEEAREQINLLKDVQNRNGFCRNILEAVFDGSSAVGEFYFWSNADIRTKLRDLFGGVEIYLKSNLINRHVLDKNFIKFNSIKFQFECRENASENVLKSVLNDFKIEITHSGYSEYNWRGETRVLVSEEVSFDYSFRSRENGEPEFYNSLFKKCQNGDIMLSPYTTWRIQLLPIDDEADYGKLSDFSEIVDLRLIGTGTYVS